MPRKLPLVPTRTAPVDKKRLMLSRLEAFKRHPDYLLAFLQEVYELVSNNSALSECWNTIKQYGSPENHKNPIVTGRYDFTMEMGDQKLSLEHKAVMITHASEVKELTFSDLHNGFDELKGLLNPILEHLELGGVVITTGDNIGEIDPNSPKYSFEVLLILCMLMQEYPRQFFYLLGHHELEVVEKWCSSNKRLREYCSLWQRMSSLEQEGISFGELKEPIYKAFCKIITELPEIAMSSVTHTIYVHASLPKIKPENVPLVDMLADEAIKDSGVGGYSRHTLDDAGFDLDLFNLYCQQYGFKQARVGHAHQSGYGCKVLGDNSLKWVEVEDRSVVTTYSSSRETRGKTTYFCDPYGFLQVYVDTRSCPYCPRELCEAEIALFNEKLSRMSLPEETKRQFQRVLEEVKYKLSNDAEEDHIILAEVLRRTQVLFSHSTADNLERYLSLARAICERPTLLRFLSGTFTTNGLSASLFGKRGGLAAAMYETVKTIQQRPTEVIGSCGTPQLGKKK